MTSPDFGWGRTTGYYWHFYIAGKSICGKSNTKYHPTDVRHIFGTANCPDCNTFVIKLMLFTNRCTEKIPEEVKGIINQWSSK